jgi:outer membrane receptor protein involved in Fe transport
LFGLPGGDARLAVGAGYRTNKLRQVIEVGFGVNDLGGDESSRFGYAEFNLPLIGPESNVTGVRSLVMTAAARSEDYDSFGRVTTPQFGVVYGPTRDFTVKGAWGKSFKAPTLYQNYISVTALLYPAATLGGQGYPANATAMYVQGGNRALKPERAETWTAALMFHPEALPNLQAELTAFGIDYSDRVVFPFTNATQGLSNPIYAPWVEYSPTVESQSNVIENADGFINATGRAYDPGNVIAILHGRFANVTRQRINGTDLSGSYRFDLDTGHLTIRGSASWLDSSQQLGADQESTALAGTLFNPAKVNGRVGLVWNRGGFTASAFANYTGGVRNVVRNESGGSFTTIDTTARYATAQNGGWSGFEFALSARNLFNQEPPMYTPASRIYQGPYDPTNYSAVGRFVSLSVSKHW